MLQPDLPHVPGVISQAEIAATAASIVAMQDADGGIPWAPPTDMHIDAWNHVESAMALLVGGEAEAAERAYDWCRVNQRPDGSWPMKITSGVVDDHSGDTNMSAYIAVGVWHHWLVRQDADFVRRMWPVVRAALDFVASMQVPFGGIAWSREDEHTVNREALLAGSASIYQAFKAGVALSELMDEPQAEWEIVAGRLGHAVREHRDLFLDKSTFSMDWYYPVLGGAVRGDDAHALLESRWETFVVPGLGIRCVDTNPWITGAETCELVMALDALGDHDTALRLFTEMQHLRHENGSYWTGSVFPDKGFWPPEQTTYTAASVILAADVLSHTTRGSDIFRGVTLPADFDEIALECDCSDERFAGLSSNPLQ
jgi:hypothetical protein